MKKSFNRRKAAAKIAACLAFLLIFPFTGSIAQAEAGRMVIAKDPVYAAPRGAALDPKLYASVPSGLEFICKNGALSLYASMANGEFAVKNEETGRIWFSNPPDRDDDPHSDTDRPLTFSLLSLHYVNMETFVDDYPSSYGGAEIDDGITVAKKADGIEVSFNFVRAQIMIPLRITLTDWGIEASVEVEQIEENAENYVLDVGLLPFFGAGGVGDDGYMVVPDGCGALIEFNNGKQGLVKYSDGIYGFDRILTGEYKTKLKENSPLPLFGIKNGDAGYAAIVTDSAAAAGVVAGVSKSGSGYNHVYPTFTLRSSGMYRMGGYYEKEIRTFEKGESRIKKCTVDYRLLEEGNANYAGMAKAFSDYLKESTGLESQNKELTSLFLELYGAIRVNQSVLGIPTKVTKPLTTFAQARMLTEKLMENGVDRLMVDYQDIDSAAIRGKVPSSIKPDGKLGGAGGYKKLKTFLDGAGVPLISNVNLTTFAQSGNGVSKSNHVAKLFTGIPGVKYTFKLSTNMADYTAPRTYYLAPRELARVAGRYVKRYNEAVYGSVGLDNLATDLYSDFSKNGSGRQEALDLVAEAAAKMAKKSTLYVRGGTDYLLPYTGYLFDMTDDISYADIVDRAIPLFQLAIAEFVPYSLTAVNGQSDPDEQLLKCVEYGGDLKFNFTYEKFGVITDPALGYLNGIWYEPWFEQAVNDYKRLAALETITGPRVITDHNMIEPGIFITTYAGGARVAVNYTNEQITVEGVAVSKMDFAALNREAGNGK